MNHTTTLHGVSKEIINGSKVPREHHVFKGPSTAWASWSQALTPLFSDERGSEIEFIT